MQQFASSLLELLLLLLLSDLVYNPYSSLSESESWTRLNLYINFVQLRLIWDFLLSPIKHYRLPKRLNIDHNPAKLKCPSFSQWQQRVESLALCNHCRPMTVDGITSAENAGSVPTKLRSSRLFSQYIWSILMHTDRSQKKNVCAGCCTHFPKIRTFTVTFLIVSRLSQYH